MSKRLSPILIDLEPGNTVVMTARDSQGRTISFNALENPLGQPLRVSIEVAKTLFAQWITKEEKPCSK